MANKAFKFISKRRAKSFVCYSAVFVSSTIKCYPIKLYEETKQKLNNTPAQYKKEFEWLNGQLGTCQCPNEPAESL